jgi:anti-sigma factor RsiW
LISRYLDGELSGPEAASLDGHLEACPRCRQLLAEEQGLSSCLRRGLAAPPEALRRLEERVLASARQVAHRAPGRSSLSSSSAFWRRASAIAALLALALYLGTRLASPPPSGPSGPGVALAPQGGASPLAPSSGPAEAVVVLQEERDDLQWLPVDDEPLGLRTHRARALLTDALPEAPSLEGDPDLFLELEAVNSQLVSFPLSPWH